jgi:hypothetical protein
MNEPETYPRPDAQEVARRMLCLDLLQHRREAEDTFLRSRSDAELAQCEEDVQSMIAFLKTTGLEESMSEEEHRAFEVPLGEWKDEIYNDASWRVESLGVVAWALGLLPRLPPFDEPFGDELADVLDIDNWEELVENANLRPASDIDRLRDIASLWNWRAQVGTPPYESEDDELEIAEEAKNAHAVGLIGQLIGGDFPVRGRAYREISEDVLEELGSIALERHYALNWLCGFGEDWDSVPTDE